MSRSRPLARSVLLAALAASPLAHAEDGPPPTRWSKRPLSSVVTEKAVRVTVPLRDLVAAPVGERLANGLLHTLTLRVALHDESDGRVEAASARTCRVRCSRCVRCAPHALRAPAACAACAACAAGTACAARAACAACMCCNRCRPGLRTTGD